VCGDDFEKKTYFPGIYDDVNILLKKAPYIENVQIVPDINKGKISALIELNQLDHRQAFKLTYEVLEKNSKKIIAEGVQKIHNNPESLISTMIEIPLNKYELWSPETPFLYELKLTTSSDEHITSFGMRSFAIDSLTKKCLLNNKPYFLRGTNVAFYRFFEDSLRGDLPWNEQWVRKLFSQFKSMNWNSLRFHVGPAPDFWYDIADEMGILIQDEYAIWYGKGGFKENRTKVTTQQLVNDYTQWMRERWNHPSIVIWDAQNETVADITGEALEIVRGIDLSNRPWDNGYSRPMRKTDIIEAHPYLFHDFHFKDSKEPEEGILKHLLSKPRMPYNDPNEQDPDPDGKYYDNAVILNEYGWLWVNRDGSPTTLSESVYKNIFKDAKTPEQYLETYAKTLAALTEYWRAHQKIAGIQHFAGLTYSRPSEPRGQTSDSFKDVVNLEFHDSFVKYVKPAFSPVALMLDIWDKSYTPNQYIDAPVYIINDLEDIWSGQISLCLYENNKLINEVVKNVQASGYNVTIENFNIKIPDKKGNFILQASLVLNGKKVISYRDMNVK
jgi:beta-galactosidase